MKFSDPSLINSTGPGASDFVFGVTSGGVDSTWTMHQIGATPPNVQTGSGYTLLLSDAGGIVERSNASANTVTIPPNANVPFIVGVRVTIVQTGAGATTINGGSGVTLLGAVVVTAGQYAGITIYQRAANIWVALQ